MATTRYFKATDGKNTYFRASPSRAYLSLTGFEPGRFGFTLHRDTRGRFPAVEITRQEYVKLVELKQARLAQAKADFQAKHPEQKLHSFSFAGNAPSDSWVRNEVLAEVGA